MEPLFLSAQREKQVLLVLTGDTSQRTWFLADHLGEVLQWPLIDVNALHYGFKEFFPFDTAKPRHEYMEGYYEAMKWLAWTQLRIKLNVIISAPFIDKDDFDKLAGVEDIFSCRLIFIDVDRLSESDLDSLRKEKDASTVRRFIESYLPDPLNIARNLQEPPPDGEPLLRICARLDDEEKEELEEEEEQEVEKEEKKGGSSCLLCCKPINFSIYSVPMHNKCAKLAVEHYHYYPEKDEKLKEEVEERLHKYNDISCRLCLGPFKLGQPVVKEEGPNYIIPGRLMHESCADSPIQLNIPTHVHPVYLSNPPLGFYYSNYCRICGDRQRNGNLYYGCYSCNHYIHKKCVNYPIETEFKCHDKKLKLKLGCTYIAQPCSACGEGNRFSAYECWKHPTMCRFKIHVQCARLPGSVYHEYHNYCDQPLTLTFSPEDDDPDNLYCEVCEKKRGQCQWFYYCLKCDFAAHLSCPTPKKRGSYTTNYLRWCRWEDRRTGGSWV